MKSRIMLAVVLGILSVAVTVPASASSTHVQNSFPFTLTGGPSPACPMLPTGFVITGSIDQTQIINTSVTNDGVMHVEVNTLELGRATDSNGATYRVNYHNHGSAAIPPGGFPFTVLQNDHFNLVGNGLATQLQMHFVVRVTFISSSDPGTVQVVNVHGDPFDCDVI
jgi:hypothetical protein